MQMLGAKCCGFVAFFQYSTTFQAVLINQAISYSTPPEKGKGVIVSDYYCYVLMGGYI